MNWLKDNWRALVVAVPLVSMIIFSMSMCTYEMRREYLGEQPSQLCEKRGGVWVDEHCLKREVLQP